MEELGLLEHFLFQKLSSCASVALVSTISRNLFATVQQTLPSASVSEEITSHVHRGNGGFMHNFSMGIRLTKSFRRGLARLGNRSKLCGPVVLGFRPDSRRPCPRRR